MSRQTMPAHLSPIRKTGSLASLLVAALASFATGCCLHSTQTVELRPMGTSESVGGELKVMALNAHITPVVSKQRKFRAGYLSTLAHDYEIDIAGFSEVFGGGLGQNAAKAAALEKLQGSYNLATEWPREKTGKRPLDSGLILASKVEITHAWLLPYKCCSQFDCFSSKGALLARLQIEPRRELAVVVTHLQSKDLNRARPTQVRQIADFLEQKGHSEGPLLVMGDFNIDGPKDMDRQIQSEYEALVEALGDPEDVFFAIGQPYGTTATTNRRCRLENEDTRRIDFIFCRDCKDFLAVDADASLVTDVCYDDPCKGKRRRFSDHRALVATFSMGPE